MTVGGLFAGIEHAESFASSVFPIAGNYVIHVNGCKSHMSRSGKGQMFIAELGILDSTVEARPAGTKMAYIETMSALGALGRVKSFLAASLGCTPEEVTQEIAEACIGAGNPLAGRLLRLEAVDGTSKKGTPVTNKNWLSMPQEIEGKNAADLAAAVGLNTTFTP